jgi:hypothetical protein
MPLSKKEKDRLAALVKRRATLRKEIVALVSDGKYVQAKTKMGKLAELTMQIRGLEERA